MSVPPADGGSTFLVVSSCGVHARLLHWCYRDVLAGSRAYGRDYRDDNCGHRCTSNHYGAFRCFFAPPPPDDHRGEFSLGWITCEAGVSHIRFLIMMSVFIWHFVAKVVDELN